MVMASASSKMTHSNGGGNNCPNQTLRPEVHPNDEVP